MISRTRQARLMAKVAAKYEYDRTATPDGTRARQSGQSSAPRFSSGAVGLPGGATPSSAVGLPRSATPSSAVGLPRSATPSASVGLPRSATPASAVGLPRSATPASAVGLSRSATPSTAVGLPDSATSTSRGSPAKAAPRTDYADMYSKAKAPTKGRGYAPEMSMGTATPSNAPRMSMGTYVDMYSKAKATTKATPGFSSVDVHGNLVREGPNMSTGSATPSKGPATGANQDGTLRFGTPTPSASAVAPMKKGKGYDWLAKQWGGGVTGSQVRQQLGGRMLHAGKNYARPDAATLASIKKFDGIKSKFNFGAKKTAPAPASKLTPERLSSLRESAGAKRLGQIPTGRQHLAPALQ